MTRPEDDAPQEASAEDAAAQEPPRRSLDTRWWWQAAVLVIAGVAIIGFQWSVVGAGDAIAATWVMVGIGVVLIGYGAVVAWRTHPSRADGGPLPRSQDGGDAPS